MFWVELAAGGASIWLAILALPWRPWSTVEALDAEPGAPLEDLSDVTVLIPARNETDTIGRTLAALSAQGSDLKVIVVDDQSADGTAEAARRVESAAPVVIEGAPLPPGWSGKLWALEQAWRQVGTPLALLLDADIELRPGLLAALRAKMRREGISFVSLMPRLRMVSAWERLLMPAFVYFFKLLYPFRLANARSPLVAAAAGGCILLEARALEAIGGFEAVRGALIDDCALARAVKRKGFRTWIGLTRSAVSVRRYRTLGTIWNMVARTAFTQLNYSPALLLVCTVVLAVGCWVPPLGLVLFPGALAKGLCAAGIAAMAAGYAPTLRYYGFSPVLGLAMPLVGTLYLGMTWTSALRFWRGERSRWKGRRYGREEAPAGPDAR